MAAITDVVELPLRIPIIGEKQVIGGSDRRGILMKCGELLREEEVKPQPQENAAEDEERSRDHRDTGHPPAWEPGLLGLLRELAQHLPYTTPIEYEFRCTWI